MKKFYLLLTVLMLTLTTVMSQTITTGAISPTSVCAGATINIPYTIVGTFTGGNFFVAQLSNSTGAFINPILLDSVYNTAAGTITAQIPYGIEAGTAYKIRVIGRTPAIIGTDNATALTINASPLLSENANNAQLGNALNFDGSNDKVTVADNTVGNFGTGAFTVEFWLKTTKGNSNLISKRSSCNGAPNFWNIKLSGTIEVELNGTGGAGNMFVSSTQSVTDGQWHHVAVTRSTAGLVTIYVDGVSRGTGSLPTPTDVGTGTNNTANVTMGLSACAIPQGVNNFKGSMDEVRLWSTERSVTQINASRFLGTLGTDNAGLVAYYDFNQGTAEGTNTTVTTLTDKSVNLKNATLTGFALTGKTSNWINSGVSNFCIGSTYSFSNSVAGGVWSVTNGTGTATITTAGVLTAVTAGTVTVNYTITTGTCSVVSKSLVNINTLPAAPTAGVTRNTVCSGGSTDINATFTAGTNIIMYVWNTSTPGTGTVLCGALNNGFSCGTGVINATTTFYLGTTNFATGCQSATRFLVVATVLAPAAPTGVNGTRCGTGTVNLSTTVSSTDYTVDWYAAATGGTALLSGNLSFTTPSLTAPATSFPRYNETIYYAQTRSLSLGCVSTTRTPVSARASHLPVAPTNATSTPVCGVGNSSIGATWNYSGGGYSLYVFQTNNPTNFSIECGSFSNNPGICTVSNVSNIKKDFWLGIVNDDGSGCQSTRIPVSVVINPVPVTTTTASPIVCSGTTSVPITAQSSGGFVGSSASGYYTGSAAPNLAIPDNSTTGVSSTINISGLGNINANTPIDVYLNLSHTYNGDLSAYLVGPNNCGALELSSRNGEFYDGMNLTLHTTGSFANITSTNNSTGGVLSGNYLTELGVTTTPVASTIPTTVVPLISLTGGACPIKGDWKLFIADLVVQDIGSLNSWSLKISNDARIDTVPVAIPDNSIVGVSKSFTISGVSGNINANTAIDVSLNLSHTFNRDLSAYLVGPNNCGALVLSSRNGLSYDGMNLTLHTTGSFANITSTNIVGGVGVISGDYLTELGVTTTPIASTIPTTVVPLVSLTGGVCPINGVWKLFIADLGANDLGILKSAAISIRGSYTNTFSGTGTFGAVTYSGISNATGVTNVTNFTSGSPIYVTTTDNNGCVSAQVSTSIIVQNIPAPTFINTSICESSSITVQGATIAGCTIDWYSAATGGTLLASGTLNYTTPVITASTTYYGQARNISTGCVSASRTPVTVNLITTTISSSSPTLVNQVTTLAGASNNTAGSADGTGSGASFNYPTGVAVDASGNVYVADTYNQKIRKITPAGVVSTLAGSGAIGSAEGIGSAASFRGPIGVAVDASGNVYVADQSNQKIRKITPAGVVSTLAGSGAIGNIDGTGSAASFYNPTGVAVDASGNVYVADGANYKVRKITPAGVVSTLAGSGDIGSFAPQGVAVDGTGNVYVADAYNHKIRKITPAGVVSTLAGNGARGSADGTGSGAYFSDPSGVSVDALGNVYVADRSNNKIRKITPAGVVSTLAGSGTYGSADGTDIAASFRSPTGVAVDASGNLYVADQSSQKIRKIIPSNLTVCSGSALTLTASGGATYSWSGPQTITNGVSFNATTSGIYTVTSIANGCTITKSIYVNVNPLPTVTVNSPSICSGISAIVTATPGVAGTYNFIWSVPAGFTNPGNVASFGTTVAGVYSVIVTNTATGCTSVSASGTVATGSNTTLAAITSITQTLLTNVCGARVYRFTATPVAGATSYNWTLPTSVGGVSGVTVDTAFSTGNIIKLKFVSNLAALTTDSIKVSATSCVSVVTKAVKLTNTLVSVPAVPASITITPVVTDSCGKKKYRYSAPALPAATTTTAAATGYVWQFLGTLGANARIDSGSLTSQTIRVSYTSDAASATGDSIKLYYTSSCGNSAVKASKLTNTLLTAPAAPTVTVTPISVNTCGARRYRYSASALPAATATAAAASGWSWSNPEGTVGSTGTRDSGTATSQTITVTYTSNAAAVAGDTIRVRFTSACGLGTSKATKLTNTALPAPAAPTVTVAAVTTNVCGARIYRYSASALPVGATGWSWSLPTGSLTGTLDSGNLGGQVIKIKYTSNAATVAGDTIRVAFNSACGLGASKATKLTNTLLAAPAAPTVTVAAITTNVCGARVYRYTASALPVATATAGAATGWSWSLPTGPTGATGTLDSGILGGQVIKIRYTSNAAAVAGDTIRVRFTSGCGLGTVKATKLTNTVLTAPLAPATVTIALVSNVCGVRVYRYTAPVLPVATTTAGAATGYAWSLPVGPVGSTGVLDSGVLAGAGARFIKIRYSSNLAASAGDSIKVAYQSVCGNGATKAQFLSNALLACVAPTPVITKVVTNASLPMSVIVYPNPTAKSFNLMVKTASSNQSAKAKIYDIQGRLIKTLVVSTNTAVNFGNDLKAGVYFVEVKEGENIKTVRVVKY